MAKKGKKKRSESNVLARNRRASHDYHLLERFEAGIQLTGTEIKSLRMRQVSLRNAFVQPRDQELWLVGATIAHYTQGNRANHEPERPRRLLLHRREINKILSQLKTKGVTVVPTRIYLKRDWAKVEIAIAKGKRQYDKREDLKERDSKRQVERALRARY